MSAAAPPLFSAPPLVNLSYFSVSLATTPVFLPAFLTLCASYPALSPFFPSARQRAWILTTIASAVMTLTSLPFVRDYALALRAGGGVADVQLRTPAAVAVNRFFQAYLAADMFMGGMYYRDQIGMLTGWVHYVAYLGITEIAIRCAWAHIFCFAACMELPTLLLGLSTLLPPLRSNTLFALAFLLTRILLHLVLLLSYARTPATRVPALILAGVFPLHVMWFAGCVRGFVRRFRARVAKVVVASKTPRHPLAPDIYPDARSLARHSSSALAPTAVPLGRRHTASAPSARARRRLGLVLLIVAPFLLRSPLPFPHEPRGFPRLAPSLLLFPPPRLIHTPPRFPLSRPTAFERRVAPSTPHPRPRVMVRRMSASLVRALREVAKEVPSREVVLGYVLARPPPTSHPDSPPTSTSGDDGRIAGVEGERIEVL
ncbi:hypothetical protein B0H16DRAFT_1683226 [Mycena metata]|uniref:TLC domain-containing protein n=1 Tax=Mycena metata TaxID=1033252 RepID=A0AAD7K5P9_9AGAR|nr:hypothetical protein B0H16DRAFT_1683226 [Mycena metata]